MGDKYKNFEELAKHENEGKDYEIKYNSRGSKILVMVPHGGGIEPYTAPLAKKIAGTEFSYYAFKGTKRNRNIDLHITSHNFNEPKALQAANDADRVVAIHGASDEKEEFIIVGGLDHILCSKIAKKLKEVGFSVKLPTAAMNATHPSNICNRGKSKKGVQLELSDKLRKALRRDVKKQQLFVDTVRGVLRAEQVKRLRVKVKFIKFNL